MYGSKRNTKSKKDGQQKFCDWLRAVRAVARLKQLATEYKGVKQRTNESKILEEKKGSKTLYC